MMKGMIDELRACEHRVTVCDIGKVNAEFALAIVIDEPIDIWYVASIVGTDGITCPFILGNFLVFPHLRINAEMFEYICGQSLS